MSPVIEHGRICGTQSAIRDITDRKQAEFAMQEAERRYRTLLGNLRGMAYRRDARDGFLFSYVSEGTRKLTGYDPEQLLSAQPCYRSIIHPDDQPRFLAEADLALKSGEPYQFEYRVRHADGTMRWIWDQGCVVNENGGPVCFEGFAIDITENKQAKYQLAESEENFRQLANASPAGIYATDIHGNCRFVNARWTQITGLNSVQAQGPAWSETIHPDDRARVLSAWDTAVRTTGSFSLEYRFLHPATGRTTWVLGQAEPVIPPGGSEVAGFIGTFTDVTEQKLLELTLRTLSTELVQQAGIMYFQVATKRLAELLESEDAFIGRWDSRRPDHIHVVAHYHNGHFLPDQSHQLPRSACAEVLIKGQTLVSNDIGSLFPVGAWVRSSTPRGYGAVPIKDNVNRVVGLVGVSSNGHWTNTNRVESILGLFAVSLGAELERQRSQTRFRALFEFSPDAIVMTDRSGAIRQVNQRATELFGWSIEEMIGQPVELLIPKEERNNHLAQRDHYTLHARPRRMGEAGSVLQALRKDGSIFPAEISLSPIETDEGMLVAAAVRDMTKQREAEEMRRKAEQEIQQAQKMESLGTLAGGIAHDFNNILTGILCYVELTKMDLPEASPAVPWIEQIAAAGQRARKLVKQILTFSRKDLQKEHAPTRIESVVNEALDLLRSSVPAMVRIERQVAKDCPLVLAEATQIHQIVMNLGTNAWHALPPSGGIIIVELSTCIVTPEEVAGLVPLRAGLTVRLSVTDNGCGMERAVLERIFEPFFTTRRAGEGTGLGLFAVHGIVRAHDGAVRVASTPGKGTRFDVYFPTIKAETPVPDTLPPYPKGSGERVLLIDDDSQGGEAIKIILQRTGYFVTHFSTPDQALTHFHSAPKQFDLVITDFAMPGMSGLALLEAIRAKRPDIPALLISGNLAQADPAAIADTRSTLTLSKPIMPRELAESVRQVLINQIDISKPREPRT